MLWMLSQQTDANIQIECREKFKYMYKSNPKSFKFCWAGKQAIKRTTRKFNFNIAHIKKTHDFFSRWIGRNSGIYLHLVFISRRNWQTLKWLVSCQMPRNVAWITASKTDDKTENCIWQLYVSMTNAEANGGKPLYNLRIISIIQLLYKCH